MMGPMLGRYVLRNDLGDLIGIEMVYLFILKLVWKISIMMNLNPSMGKKRANPF